MNAIRKNNNLFRIISSALILIAAGIEAYHSLIERVPWNGFTLAVNYFSIPLIAVWCASLVGIWSANAVFKPFMFFGIFFLFMHGAIISLGNNTLVGGIYMGCSLLSAITAAISHRGESARIRQVSRPNLRIAS